MANIIVRPDGSRMSLPDIRRAYVRGGSRALREATPIYPVDRLAGTLCACNGNGVFTLDAYEPGQKQYMTCRTCGGVSHL